MSEYIQIAEDGDGSVISNYCASLPGSGFALASNNSLVSGIGMAQADTQFRRSTNNTWYSSGNILGIWQFDTLHTLRATSPSTSKVGFGWVPSTAGAGAGHMQHQTYQVDGTQFVPVLTRVNIRMINTSFNLASLGYASAISLYANSYSLASDFYGEPEGDAALPAHINSYTVTTMYIDKSKYWVPGQGSDATIGRTSYSWEFASLQGLTVTAIDNVNAGSTTYQGYGLFFKAVAPGGTGTGRIQINFGSSGFPNATYYVMAIP